MSLTLKITLKVIKTVLLLDLIVLIILLAIKSFTMPMVYGLIFGSIFSILNFRILAITLEKAITMQPDKAQRYTINKHTLRIIFTGIVIFISLKATYINPVGTIIGLLLPSISIYILNFLSKIKV